MQKLIVVLPGTMGSKLGKESFTVWPTLFPLNIGLYEEYLPIGNDDLKPAGLIKLVYSKLVRSLKKENNFIVEQFAYDWRLNNLDNVETLDRLMRRYPNVDEIHFVSHSMGGILTKLFLNTYSQSEYIPKIKNFITLGTPWHGAMEAYKTLIYGSGMPVEEAPLLITKQTSKLISSGFPSVYQLLPSEEYCKRVLEIHKVPALTINDNVLTHQEMVNGYDIKEFLDREELTYKRVFEEYWDLLNKNNASLAHINHHEIIGIGHLTLSAIYKNNLGEVSGYFKNGDGTVPIFSAKSDSPTERYFIHDASHQKLPKKKLVRDIIKSIINGDSVEEVEGLIKDEEKIKNYGFMGRIIRIACPVRISILKDGQSIYGFSDDLSVENYDELLKSNLNIVSLGSTVYLLLDDRENQETETEKIIIEAYDEGPTNVSIEQFNGIDEPKNFSFSTFKIKPSMIAELNLSRNISEISLEVKEDGKPIINKKPHENDADEVILPTTHYTIHYDGTDFEGEDIKRELLVCIGEVSLSINSIDLGTFKVANTYLKINDNIKEVNQSGSEENIHQDLEPGFNTIKIFSVDVLGNVEEVDDLNLYYSVDFKPNINFEFLPHQYIIQLSDDDKLHEINSIIGLKTATKIDVTVNIDENVFISENNALVIINKAKPNRTFKITYNTPFGVFEEVLIIDEDALLSVFEGTGDSRNFNDFLEGLQLDEPEEIKIYRIEGTRTVRTINDKNLSDSKRIYLSKGNKKFELVKKSDYIVSFHHLVEDIKIGEMQQYFFSFKVFNELDREIKDLDLDGFIKIAINQENPLSEPDDIKIRFNQKTNLYEGSFDVKVVEKILEGYWDNTPIHSSELLITNGKKVLRVKEIKVRKKDKK